MADEMTLTTNNDPLYAAQMGAVLMDEIRPKDVMRPLMDEQVATGSQVFQWNIRDDPGAAAAKTEATDLANTSLTTSNQQATCATVGIMASPTDELRAHSLVDMLRNAREVLGRSVREKFTIDTTALLDDTTNSTTTSGVDMTTDTFLAGVAALIARDIDGPFVAVGSGVQATDLQRDARTSTAAIYGNPQWNVGMTNPSSAGFQYNFAGVDVYQSSAVPTANSGADAVMGIFVPRHTFGLAVAPGWPIPRIELERDASNVLTEVVGTGRYGSVLKRANDAQEVITDA